MSEKLSGRRESYVEVRDRYSRRNFLVGESFNIYGTGNQRFGSRETGLVTPATLALSTSPEDTVNVNSIIYRTRKSEYPLIQESAVLYPLHFNDGYPISKDDFDQGKLEEKRRKLERIKFSPQDGANEWIMTVGVDSNEKTQALHVLLEVDGQKYVGIPLEQENKIIFRTFYPFETGPLADGSGFEIRVDGEYIPDPQNGPKISFVKRLPNDDMSSDEKESQRQKYLEKYKDAFSFIDLEGEIKMVDIPAIAYIKTNPENLIVRGRGEISPFGQELLHAMLHDKGFDVTMITDLSQRGRLAADLFNNLVLRASRFFPENGVNRALSNYATEDAEERHRYVGLSGQNMQIDGGIKASSYKLDKRREKSGHGATPYFRLGDIGHDTVRNFVGDTPVVILGAGPAGILAAKGLMNIGFNSSRIYVIDKQGESGGIWNQKNVFEGSKNNPFLFDFEGLTADAAPGPGRSITEFLTRAANNSPVLPRILRGSVTEVIPGDLNHTVHYKTGSDVDSILAPIVINTIGVGKPLTPSREGYMTTSVKGAEAGIRWQQILTPEQAEKYRNKRLIFIGLGNSTAEMLTQVSALNRDGYNIDYRVLTHIPQEALDNPSGDVIVEGKTFHVFRDIKKPVLTRFAGDLDEIRSVYYESLYREKIIPSVIGWEVNGKSLSYTQKDGSTQTIDFEQLFTLIGFGYDTKVLEKMGFVVTDNYKGTIARDYDGEIQKNPGVTGRDRVYPGYFGLGALIKDSDSPNDEVIPGIMHRLYDLLFTATLRAAEADPSERSIKRFSNRLSVQRR